jgi:RNA polymerase sigma-70 factor, ECF subfamily
MANPSQNYVGKTDKELLQLLAQNDEQAFRTLYARYAEQLYIVAFRKLPLTHKAEDLVQEIFIQLYRGRAKAVDINDLRAWMLACLRNMILNELRTMRIHERHHLELSRLPAYQAADPGQFDLRLLESNFQAAMTQLTTRCRQVFTLSRVEELPNGTIAEQLNVSVKAVEKQVTNALRIMRKEIDFIKSL